MQPPSAQLRAGFDRLRANGFGAFVALLFLLFAAASPAGAQTFPKFTGFVVDAANVLPPETESDLTRKLDAVQKDTHRQFVVATIPDLQGYPIADYGYRLGRAWGVGLKDANNGVILFIAPNEPKGQRGPRIEVGTGLEPVMTDALSSVIINQDMMPKLQAGDVPGAMEAGADSIIAQLRASPDEAKARTDAAIAEFDRTHRRSSGNSGGGIPIGLIIWLVIIGFFFLSGIRGARRGSRYRGGTAPVILWGPSIGSGWGSSDSGSSWGSSSGSSWSSGGDSGGGWGGGGFSGGGGGGFSGGGASGGW